VGTPHEPSDISRLTTTKKKGTQHNRDEVAVPWNDCGLAREVRRGRSEIRKVGKSVNSTWGSDKGRGNSVLWI